ncbi:MAG: DNRLRE domain-containing protein [Anaerolineaceae bacterium]|nr:DNRLRE domain-containing protein [Anaerolineaceae bacterium]
MRTKILIVIILLISLFALSSAVGINSTSVSAFSPALTFSAVASAVVDSSQPDAVLAQSNLMTDGVPEIDSYVRFNVSGLSGPVGSAVLQVTSASVSGSGFIVRSVVDNSWDPSSITFGNAPAMGSVLGSSGAFGVGVVTSLDVSAIVLGNGSYSFALTSSDPLPVSYSGTAQLVILPAVVTPTANGPAFGTPTLQAAFPGAGGSGTFPAVTPTAPVGSTPVASHTDEPDKPGQP